MQSRPTTAPTGRAVIPSHVFIHNRRAKVSHRQKTGIRDHGRQDHCTASPSRATDSDAFEYTARAGFAASGVLHLLVAYIILRIAFGAGGNADQSGALATLAGQTGGTLILWVVAVGLVALGLWRVAEAIVGSKPGERSGRGQGRHPCLEARQVPRAGDRELRDRVLGGALRDGKRSTEQSAELRTAARR